MNKIIKICYCLFIAIGISSCEKDVITNEIMENKERAAEEALAFKKALHNAPNGWVMMVKSIHSANSYAPIVLKFDTTKNVVDVKTVYGITNPSPALFEVGSGTGSLLLTFSTGSVMTAFFRIGQNASDITDHIYKVLKVTDDMIQIQPYRSGIVYKPEGGVIYTLFKRPDDWKWADNTINLDYSNAAWRTGVVNRDGILDIEYVDGSPKTSYKVRFGVMTDANIASYRTVDPFFTNVSAKGFVPFYPIIFDYALPTSTTYNTTTDRIIPTLGHNAIAFYPYSGNATTNQNQIAFDAKIKIHYLILTSMTRSDASATAVIDMNFVAYDKTGKVYANAKYSLK